LNYIVLAIPVFFVLIAIELVVTRLLERDYYTLSDTLADLSCGTVQQLLEIVVKTGLFAAYVGVYQYRFFSVPSTAAWAWVVCFLGVDFLYYWFHRLSHEINAFWAAHVVHHQSEEYNLSVALRQGALQGWFSWAFYLPLALCGFPPPMYLTLTSVNTLYQFWIHTRVIGRLGPLEWVLNTPSNHRVHHGRNPKYIDRNHGGTLIVWDRLFGTFAQEEEEPVYGVTTPLRSWNPIWANIHVWAELFSIARRATRFRDRLQVFLRPPGWRPEELGGFSPAPEIDPRNPPEKFRTPRPKGLLVYSSVQFVPVLLLSSFLLRDQERLGPAPLLLGSLVVLAAFVSLAGLLEGKSWSFPLELGRTALVALLIPLFGRDPRLLLPVTIAAVALLGWLFSYRKLFRVATG
jgi:sterol desaturase/sphingolipid hydroxylase (fatty acid hydroxylase superfamily)